MLFLWLIVPGTAHAAEPGSVVVNEIAWMGSNTSPNDEWIELYNTTDRAIVLSGWTLRAEDGAPVVELSGTIDPKAFFLLERTDDTTVVEVAADLTFTGALSNEGEALVLLDEQGNVIDQVNADGGPWPAGDNESKRSMERINPLAAGDDPNWATYRLSSERETDTQTLGTPKQPNSVWAATPLCDSRHLDASPGVPVEIELAALCDSEDVEFSVHTQPAHGDLDCDAERCAYTPNPDYVGEDKFALLASDEAQSTVIEIGLTIGGGAASPDAVFFVDALNGSDANDGLSPARPLATIQAAVDGAAADARIMVLGGHYRDPVVIDKPIALEAVAATTLEAPSATAISVTSSGVSITGFSIQNSAVGIDVGPDAQAIQIHRSALVGNEVAIRNQSQHAVNSANVWWGCNAGPNQPGCDSTFGKVSATPWLVASLAAPADAAPIDTPLTLTVDLTYNSNNERIPSVLSRPVTIRTELENLSQTIQPPASSAFVEQLWGSVVSLAVLVLMTDWRKACGGGARGLMLSLCCLVLVTVSGCGGAQADSANTSVLARQLEHGVLRFDLTSPTAQTLTVTATMDGQTLSAEVTFFAPN